MISPFRIDGEADRHAVARLDDGWHGRRRQGGPAKECASLRDQLRRADGKGSRSCRRVKRCQCRTTPTTSAGTKPAKMRKVGSPVGEMKAIAMSEITHKAANRTAKS